MSCILGRAKGLGKGEVPISLICKMNPEGKTFKREGKEEEEENKANTIQSLAVVKTERPKN